MGLLFWNSGTPMAFVTAAALAGSLLVSYAKARGEVMGVTCKEGLMQRPEKVVYLGVGSILSPILVLLVRPYVDLPLDTVTTLAVSFVAIMTWVTAIQRIRRVMRALT
ncbi:MAG: hypothetical protein HY391_01140 [Deltaproteobacteria bacterium]|nr:hypothetical protein [Deltaproteobacteria bacterium]